MVSFDLKIPQTELSSRLQKLMFLRLLFISFLLGTSISIQVKETSTYFGDIQTAHYLLIAAIYFLTFIYIIFLKYLKDLIKLAYAQLLIDTFFITAMIYTTGGIESIFSFLYILTIINGSIILYRKGGMTLASSSSILYGLLLDLHYYNLIHPFGSGLDYTPVYQSTYIFFMIVVNIGAFYLVAFLSSYPSEQARKSRIELKARQDDIIKLEALNERIIDSITSGLITLDDQKRIILFNPAAEDIFAIKARQIIGRKVVDIFPFLSDFIENGSKLSDQNLQKQHSFVDIPYLAPYNRKIFLRITLSPLNLPEEGQKGQILVFQDITEMRRIEEELKKVEGMALIGELAAGISHEIRNPMASISGSIQMLKEGLDKEDVNNRLMDIILREINRLNHLVNDFLLFARPKPPNLKEFDLNQLIIDSLELFKNSGSWTEEIRVETNFHRPLKLESDPEQIRQILWNLFLNGVEAMPSGGLLHINTEIVHNQDIFESGRAFIKITIKDTGQGFSEKALHHLFTPFFTTKEGGSGLGLAIVKRIIEGLKGKVNGKNHPDGGSEITIFLQMSSS
ncbi:MAG: ATP-binding protein [Thermodesulfobacteriota bacterium]|nr:ATP-binding protein [Thermodesulfobacteriota bacterium]